MFEKEIRGTALSNWKGNLKCRKKLWKQYSKV